jgi:WhiB family transcriptional regulator, redox-sensing transcriptional regulator
VVRLLTRGSAKTPTALTGVSPVKTSRQERNLSVTRQEVAVHSAGEPVDACGRTRPVIDVHIPVDDTEEYTAMDWRHRALCRDEDPELFFPIGTTGPALVQIEQAKAVCRRCPVTQSCLDWALRAGQDSGVWGGLSEDERRALKRRQARTRVRTA